MDELRSDLKELKSDVKELIKQGAVHNELLRTHEARSLSLQKEQEVQASKLVPIQRHIDISTLIYKGLGAVFIALVIQALLHAVY